jgi:hypothetical protein
MWCWVVDLQEHVEHIFHICSQSVKQNRIRCGESVSVVGERTRSGDSVAPGVRIRL